jgi:hypothetical protein
MIEVLHSFSLKQLISLFLVWLIGSSFAGIVTYILAKNSRLIMANVVFFVILISGFLDKVFMHNGLAISVIVIGLFSVEKIIEYFKRA